MILQDVRQVFSCGIALGCSRCLPDPSLSEFFWTCSLIGAEFPCASVSKRVLMQYISYVNEFYLNENEPKGEHTLRNGFADSFYHNHDKRKLGNSLFAPKG